MPVVTCPECTKKLNVPDTAVGKKAKCPGCNAVFAGSAPAPAPAAAPLPLPPEPKKAAPPARPPDLKKGKQPPEPEPLPLDADEGDEPAEDAAPGLRCPKCEAEAVRVLPPNQFSRRPGYVCAECGAVMRRAGTAGNYYAAIGVGVVISLLGAGMSLV